MGDALAHRGPDDSGFLETATRDGTARVGLAHRRLSIIDLATGHQPLGNEDGSVQIVFNGEIYNFSALRDELISAGHRFSTRSDTETIVHAYEQWGIDCVSRFRGMFAFAIWDAGRDRLFLARDRFGKKPLFLYERDGLLLFASEIKAILAFPGVEARIERDALCDYFSYRYVPGPATLFAGIRKLAPGSHALWENGRLVECTFYVPPDREMLRSTGVVPDPVAAFLGELDEAVRVRMVSDVPFGAFLSGGIDSSAVVGLMRRHSSLPVKTFSVGFAEGDYSELRYAKTIADHFSTEHHELPVSHRDLMDNLSSLVRFRDAPVAEPSDIPLFLLARQARHTVKMVLTGEGADEVLGGYPKHVYERFVPLYQMVPAPLRRSVVEPLVRALPYGFRRINTAVAAMGTTAWHERMPRWFGALSEENKRALLRVRCPPSAGASRPSAPERGNSALRAILYFDQTSWLPDNLLERGDRNTMAASLEARMPFMDHQLIAFISNLPDHWRIRGLNTKRLLREAMRNLLPDTILRRPKVGFRVPVNEWFRGPMREYLFDHLRGPSSLTRDYYQADALQRVLDEHTSRRRNHEKLLWSLLTLEIWHREYRVAASP